MPACAMKVATVAAITFTQFYTCTNIMTVPLHSNTGVLSNDFKWPFAFCILLTIPSELQSTVL